MIEGARLLPWLGTLERLGKRHAYNCERCMETTTRQERRSLKCGWIDRDEWRAIDPSWGVIGQCRVEPEWCPGYTTRSPAVLQVARLWGWIKEGTLSHRLAAEQEETPCSAAFALHDEFAMEQALAERWEIDERSKAK